MRPGEARGCKRQSLELNGPSTTSMFLQNRTLNPDVQRRQIHRPTIIIFYPSRKGLSTVAIHDDLVATLGAEAVSYPSMTRSLREAIFASSHPPDPVPLPDHQLDNSDQVVLLALAGPPFASIRELSRLTHLPRTTVHSRLTQSLRFHVHHLRWEPNFL
jgi:hypothetical protein